MPNHQNCGWAGKEQTVSTEESKVSDISIGMLEGLREFVLQPPRTQTVPGEEQQGAGPANPSGAPPLRVIGPGRFERGYLQRLSALAAEVEMARDRDRRFQESLREGKAALEVSQRVERGCQRRIDRLEGWLEQRTQALLESERQQKRLALALGSMQREVELLRAQTAPVLTGAAAVARTHVGPTRASLWRRIFGPRG